MSKKVVSIQNKHAERCMRSIGIMTPEQLERISRMRIGVAGLGLGGSVFINLVRLGFQRFHVADPDVYERTNINRQRAARETTVGCRKDDCLIQEARAINPDIEVSAFRDGVTEGNVTRFLDGVDWLVDAVDLFALREKITMLDEAAERKIPLVTCVSVGFGASIMAFDKSTPSVTQLSGMDRDQSYKFNVEKFVGFVTPEIPDYMRAQTDQGLSRSSHLPFVVPGVEMAASLVATEICKQILGLGTPVLAPEGIYLDPVNLRFERFSVRGAKRKPAVA
jgi:molybdopterin/thiamine biosynthesis adenylyltransferase